MTQAHQDRSFTEKRLPTRHDAVAPGGVSPSRIRSVPVLSVLSVCRLDLIVGGAKQHTFSGSREFQASSARRTFWILRTLAYVLVRKSRRHDRAEAGQGGGWDPASGGHTKALMPVMARPTISVFISRVPS
jgi:hypothetical protein